MSPGKRNERVCRRPFDSVTVPAAQARQMMGTTSSDSHSRQISRRAGILYSEDRSSAAGELSFATFTMARHRLRSKAGDAAHNVTSSRQRICCFTFSFQPLCRKCSFERLSQLGAGKRLFQKLNILQHEPFAVILRRVIARHAQQTHGRHGGIRRAHRLSRKLKALGHDARLMLAN